MTDSEKLDLLLAEVQGMKSEAQEMKSDMQGMKSEIQEMKSDMQGMKSEIQEMKSDMQGMKSEIREMKSDMQGMKSEIQEMKSDIQELKETVSGIDTEVKKIDLTLENEIRVNIKRIAEGHFDLSRNLHEAMKIDSEKEMLSIRVTMLETQVREIRDMLKRIA